ncbi:hypothetical protein CPLU01_04965 [Colletotrichum plurivorum]|uniref:Uncharacterized protein n=1 Tax=Colletotrichum plurivorum TaxID=2175906 RepID=A0A8H6KMM0_9PEZI|nr:hypothetical protein CPLU01_04965 [Colletotrichum plurivorum]
MSENTATAPGRWTNPALLQSLMVTFYGYAKDNIDKDAKEAIIQKMHGEGFEYLNWDMLRIKTFFMAEKTSTDGKWANPVLLEALVMGFHSVTKQEEGLSKDAKDEIVSKVMKWTAEVDQHILVAMVKTFNPTSEQYDSVMSFLEPAGYGFTVSALNIIIHLILPHLVSTMAPTVWDDKARSDLLVELHPIVKPTKEEWDQVLAAVRLRGYNYTSNAVLQHIQKLQRMEAAQANDNGEGPSTSAPATPKKTAAKKTATPRKRKTPAKKAKSEEDDEDNAEEPTPKKLRAPERPTFAEDLTVVKTDDGSI